MRLQAKLADDIAALAEGVNVAVDVGDLAELRAFEAHELEVDRQEVLTDDVEARLRQQMVDVGHASGERVLDRNHGVARLARLNGGNGVLEGRAGQGLEAWEDLVAGEMRIGARLALVRDPLQRGGVR